MVLPLQAGTYILQLMDAYAASWSVFLLAILETVVISWIYGKGFTSFVYVILMTLITTVY
jgi:hypothetical protein